MNTEDLTAKSRGALERLSRANLGTELIQLAQADIPVLANAVIELAFELETYQAELTLANGNIVRLSAEVERLKAPVTWSQLDFEDGDTWQCSGCGWMTVWEEGTPEENGLKFCFCCGHPVKFERYVDPCEDETPDLPLATQ